MKEEFTSNRFHKYYKEHGMQRLLTVPRSPNKMIQRKGRTRLFLKDSIHVYSPYIYMEDTWQNVNSVCHKWLFPLNTHNHLTNQLQEIINSNIRFFPKPYNSKKERFFFFQEINFTNKISSGNNLFQINSRISMQKSFTFYRGISFSLSARITF